MNYKLIKFLSQSFKLNEIHTVIALSTRIPKIYNLSRKALILEEGRPEKSGKMGNKRDIYCYANLELVNFEREYQPLPPGSKILVMPRFSNMPDQILGKKN